MDQATFDRFREIVYAHSGISLGPTKQALVSSRVGRRLRVLGIDDYRQYLEYVDRDDSGGEIVNLLDAISTNVTSFFREAKHFDVVGHVVADWLERGQKRFRFWSAACSTGEEPYSLAITLLEKFGGCHVDAKILATDISTQVLETAKEASYEQEKLRTAPTNVVRRYFLQEKTATTPHFVVRDDLKRMVTFRRLNLSTPPFPMRGPIDIVFCRNVMIYFDNAVRRRLLGEIHRLLKPGGYLMVGHAESLTGMADGFSVVQPSVYMKQ